MAKNSSWPVTGLGNKGPLKVLNGTKLILDDHGNNLDSFRISLESFRSFRGPLLLKPVTGQELFFAVSYSKPALAKLHFPESGFTIPRLWHSVCTWALIVLSKNRIWIWFHFRFRIRHQALLPVLRLHGGRYPNGIGPWGWQGKGFFGQFLYSQPFDIEKVIVN